MDAAAQIQISAFATALFLCLALQESTLACVYWWLCASSLGLFAALLEWPSGGAPGALVGSIVLFCLCLQLGCVACGFLSRHTPFGRLRSALPASVLPGLLLLIYCRRSPMRINAACGLISIAILAVVVAFFLSRHRSRHRAAVTVITAVLLMGIVRQLVGILITLHWPQGIDAVSADLLRLNSWTGSIASGGSILALLLAAFHEAMLRHQQMQEDAENLQQLIESTDHGICRIDRGGRITYVNPAAAAMLALSGGKPGRREEPAEAWIQEKLKADEEPSSIRTMADFVLRPTAFIERAMALIPGRDRPALSVEWSCHPIHRGGETEGAVITLGDATEREAAVRFIRFRSDLLEMIARNKPVEEVTRLLVAAVEQRLPGYSCAVLICAGEFFQVVTSPRTPEALRSALKTVHCNRILQTNDGKGSIEMKGWEDTLRTVAREHGYAGTRAEPMVSAANELLGTVVLNHLSITSLESSQILILHEAARIGALAFEHHGAYQRLLHQGYHDALTGLPNRLLLADRLKQALARAERNQTHLAFLSIDLDHFKDINDNLGHDAGDLFLRQISARMATRVRVTDTLARTGGDEFTLLLPDLQDARDAGKVAEALTTSLGEPFEVEEHTLYGSASIGVAVYPRDGRDAEALQRNADRAMYRAKSQGRNMVCFYSGDETVEDRNRIDIELYLHRAIEQKSFSLCFQPQYTCDHQLDGFEALLRFQHPKLGMVPPSRFIPMAEESGLILPIGNWVLLEVCRQIREWQDKGLPPIRVALNVSPLQLARGDFAQAVSRAIRSSKIKPELLEIELTEGVLMSSVPDSNRQIAELARIGVRLSVDDFGTGYSCLSYLHQLPLHTLKIDRSFISRMLEPDGTRCIVEAIVTLARNLGLRTVAEGVETDEQLTLLRAVGCDLIQGYLFSKPLSPIDAAALLWKSTLSEPSGNLVCSGKLSARGHARRPLWTRFSGRRLD